MLANSPRDGVSNPNAEAQHWQAYLAQWDSVDLHEPMVGARVNSDHIGLPEVGTGSIGEPGLNTEIHALGVGWEDALWAVRREMMGYRLKTMETELVLACWPIGRILT